MNHTAYWEEVNLGLVFNWRNFKVTFINLTQELLVP